MRSKRFIISITILSAILLAAIFAEFVAPYDPVAQDRTAPFMAPTRVHWIDAHGEFHVRPFVYATASELTDDHARVYREDRTRRYPIRMFCAAERTLLWKVVPLPVRLFGVDAPGRIYLCGTDWRGRDIFSRMVFGARISLSIACAGVIVAVGLGSLIGAISGYCGGWIDVVLMRVTEMFMMLPLVYLLLAVRSALPFAIDSLAAYGIIVAIISLVGWTVFARVVRGIVLSVKQQDFVAAARVLGAGQWFIISKHILPQTTSFVLVAMSSAVPGFIVAEATLSMLGLGIQEPYVSWGMLLGDSMHFVQLSSSPWLLAPGFVIVAAIVCFHCVSDCVRDAVDPQGTCSEGVGF